jgi:hypothetical protein
VHLRVLCGFRSKNPRTTQATRKTIPLHRDSNCNPDSGISAVVHVVAIVNVGYIHVVIVIPVIAPVFRPRINRCDPIAPVLEAWIASIHHERQAVDAKSVFWSEVSAEPVVGNAVSVIATALVPVAMVGIPALRAMPLPCALLDAVLLRRVSRLLVASVPLIVPHLPLLLRVLLIASVLPLLLCTLLRLIVPVLFLLLGPLWLLASLLPLLLCTLLRLIVPVLFLLLGPLLLLASVLPLLLCTLLRLIVPVLSLLLSALRLLPLFLSVLGLLGLLPLLLSMLRLRLGLLFALLLCRVILLFILVLCVSRSNDSEQQRQNSCTDDSHYSHKRYLYDCWV